MTVLLYADINISSILIGFQRSSQNQMIVSLKKLIVLFKALLYIAAISDSIICFHYVNKRIGYKNSQLNQNKNGTIFMFYFYVVELYS